MILAFNFWIKNNKNIRNWGEFISRQGDAKQISFLHDTWSFIVSIAVCQYEFFLSRLQWYCRHGIFQLLSGWADGPGYVTQCPIQPGSSYTYRFNITGQEGTLWWHAHSSWLRATVYGALLIRPRAGRSYPFPKPHREFPIILGTLSTQFQKLDSPDWPRSALSRVAQISLIKFLVDIYHRTLKFISNSKS